ncbi:MAG TPA: hypothetical protein VFV99_04545, partial [Kofleriaceae bacterium]|nr:hypothetical protein [Kofleriaceae bacterium]
MARRVPPLAAAIVLVAAGLVATAWSTRRAVNDAFDAVGEGQAFTIEQGVRADLADLGGPPGNEELAGILGEHAQEGLVYLATLDGRGRVQAAAGTPLGGSAGRADRVGVHIEHVGDRVRIEVRTMFRRAWGPGRGSLWVAMEIEPVQAAELRSAASRTLAIGLVGAIMLLG